MVSLGKFLPCQSREAVVTVLSYNKGIMDGYLQHPRLDGRERIVSLSQLVLLLNDLVELESCPNPVLPLVSGGEEGEEGSTIFRIQVLFREHYSWQGKLIWQNENQEVVFRSVIELIQIFDEILEE